MSYIRSSSNPERLYVFGDAESVEWYWGHKSECGRMRGQIFEQIMRFVDKECVPDEDEIPEGLNFFYGMAMANVVCKDFSKIVITYWDDFTEPLSTWQIEMWEVTFYYILNNWRHYDHKFSFHLRELYRDIQSRLFSLWIKLTWWKDTDKKQCGF